MGHCPTILVLVQSKTAGNKKDSKACNTIWDTSLDGTQMHKDVCHLSTFWETLNRISNIKAKGSYKSKQYI